MKTIAEWVVWVLVFWLSVTSGMTSKGIVPVPEEGDDFDVFNRDARVLSWLIVAGCAYTLVYPVSKFHLLWWVIAANGIFLIWLYTGQKLLFLALFSLWVFRFGALGWAALPGNLRVAALLVAAIGLAGLLLGPTRSFGLRSKSGSAVWLAVGGVSYLIFQFF